MIKLWINMCFSKTFGHSKTIQVLCLLSLMSTEAIAQETVLELKSPEPKPSGSEVQVIGADPQSPDRWKATYVFRNSVGGGCTATAVGPRTVLTAAHCIEDGTIGRVNTPAGKVRIACDHHPDYVADFSADFALCYSTKNLPTPYENINVSASRPKNSSEIFLLGFGCRTEGGGDENFGQLYGGTAQVFQTSGPNTNYVRTKGGAAVCFGDSGGGAFLFDPTGTRRVLFGVNSRGDISKYSSISATNTDTFLDWAKEWLNEKDTGVCGFTQGVGGCSQTF